MKKHGMRALVFWMVLIIGGLACTVGFGWKPLLGLDLQGGLSATLTPKAGTNPTTESVQEAAAIIRQRVDGLGIAEPQVVRSGRTVVVELPGLKTRADQDRAKKIIGTTAKLEFRKVIRDLGPTQPASTTTKPGSPTTKPGSPTTKPGSPTTKPGATTVPGSPTTKPGTATTVPGASSSPTTTGAPASSKGTNSSSQGEPVSGLPYADPIAFHRRTATTVPPATTVPAAGSTPPTTVAGQPQIPTTTVPQIQVPAGSQVFSGDGQSYLLGPLEFSGTVISSSQPQLNTQSSQWEVNVTIKGRDQSQVTKAFNACYSGDPNTCPAVRQGDDGQMHGAIAMVLDGKVISAPTVNSLDLPKNPQGFVITGNFTNKTAKELALQLRYGALPVEFQPATLETVSATLGSNSLRAGIIAGLVGLAAVAIYMLIFYRLLGLVAILSLATSTALVWTIISYLGAHSGLALTLAGITGIIVSIGVAVDSNVVFYEHLREDMTKGRSLRSTVNHSFDTAWRTILSADFVSLIGAVILYLLTVGSVRGFAFYLGLSTLTDLLASWFFMRPVVFWLASKNRFNDRPGLLGVRPHRSASQGMGESLTAEVVA